MNEKEISIEKKVKENYARIFLQDDWVLFKEIAEYYLNEAAFLKIIEIKNRSHKKLLRNIRKRLYIGIACELILKAFYLKSGYVINLPNINITIAATPPYKFADVNITDFNKYDTITLNALIQQLPKVYSFTNRNDIIRGLTIAKVFRNKEGHVAIDSHTYIEKEYTDIEKSFIELYREGFKEMLSLQISMESNENPMFDVKPLNK